MWIFANLHEGAAAGFAVRTHTAKTLSRSPAMGFGPIRAPRMGFATPENACATDLTRVTALKIAPSKADAIAGENGEQNLPHSVLAVTHRGGSGVRQMPRAA